MSFAFLSNWIKRVIETNNTDIALDLPAESQLMLDDLNLKSALDAHNAWKARLKAVLTKQSDEILAIDTVGSDNVCTLGKWLHGTAKLKYDKYPEYHTMLAVHAEFHIAAANVLIEYQSGDMEQAKYLLSNTFRHASNRNQLELVKLFMVINNSQ